MKRKPSSKPIRFARKDPKKFFQTLNARVNTYFNKNKRAKTGNWRLHLKAVVMFGLLTVPYFLILLSDWAIWIKLLLTIVMGIGVAGVGMNIMHDGKSYL